MTSGYNQRAEIAHFTARLTDRCCNRSLLAPMASDKTTVEIKMVLDKKYCNVINTCITDLVSYISSMYRITCEKLFTL